MVEPCLDRALWDVIAVRARGEYRNPDRSVTVLTFATTTKTSFCQSFRATQRSSYFSSSHFPRASRHSSALFLSRTRLISSRFDKLNGGEMNNGGRNRWGEAASIRKFREAKRSRRREREKKRIDGCITKRSMVIEGRGEITKSRRFAKRVGIVGYGAV